MKEKRTTGRYSQELKENKEDEEETEGEVGDKEEESAMTDKRM